MSIHLYMYRCHDPQANALQERVSQPIVRRLRQINVKSKRSQFCVIGWFVTEGGSGMNGDGVSDRMKYILCKNSDIVHAADTTHATRAHLTLFLSLSKLCEFSHDFRVCMYVCMYWFLLLLLSSFIYSNQIRQFPFSSAQNSADINYLTIYY